MPFSARNYEGLDRIQHIEKYVGLHDNALGPYVPTSGDTSGATDYANITAAIAANGQANLGPGTFYVNQPITLSTNYQELTGAGRGQTLIQAATAMLAPVRLTALENRVADLALDGNFLAVHELDMVRSPETSVQHVIERVRFKQQQAVPVKNTNGDGNITSGSAVFTSATGAFTANDVGKWMIVSGAGSGAVNLVAQILSYQSATQVTLDVNAGTTVTTANYEYWGVSINNVGCEDCTYYDCNTQGSEATPGNLAPIAFISLPTGAMDILNCRFFGPIFYKALNLNVVGGVAGPLVSVNPAGTTTFTLNVDGAWVYDGGSPTSYAPFDVCATFMPTHIITTGCHIVSTLAATWFNGQMVSGGSVTLGPGNVYVQPNTNANTTMTILNQTAGSTNTRSVCEGGRVSTTGSATIINYRAGGASSHTNVQRGKLTWGGGTVSGTTTQPTAPAIPSSGAAFTNAFGSSCLVYITGGTVTGVAVDGVTVATATSATLPVTVQVRAMGTVTLTYSVAPTWVWQPIN